MIPGSKGQKAVRACTIKLLNLGHAKYEKVAIEGLREQHSCGAIRDIKLGSKNLLTLTSYYDVI